MVSSPDTLPVLPSGATEEKGGLQLSAVIATTLDGRGTDPNSGRARPPGGGAEAESPGQEEFAWQIVEGGRSC